jgi:hypothetical protein
MINIGNILKRAWHILWNYKVLWIFGILLAITIGGGGARNSINYRWVSNGGNNGNNGYPWLNPDYNLSQNWDELRTLIEQEVVPLFQHPGQHIATLIWIGVGLLLFILVVAVIVAFVRYVSETALLRMVDGYEQTGTKVGFKQGWKLGWSRRAFRLWLIDFIIGLPAFIFLALLLGLGVLFFISVVNGNIGMAVAGTISAIGLTFVFILVFSLLMVFLSLLRQFFARSVALEDTRVGESFRRGWAMFRHNWKSAALMWLVMFAIGIGFAIASVIAFFLLIPVYLILLIPAILVAAVPALIAFGITSLFTHWIVAAIVAAVFGVPLFFMLMFSPMAFLNGLYNVFESTIWTLTYREMKTLESLQPKEEIEAPAEKG